MTLPRVPRPGVQPARHVADAFPGSVACVPTAADGQAMRATLFIAISPAGGHA